MQPGVGGPGCANHTGETGTSESAGMVPGGDEQGPPSPHFCSASHLRETRSPSLKGTSSASCLTVPPHMRLPVNFPRTFSLPVSPFQFLHPSAPAGDHAAASHSFSGSPTPSPDCPTMGVCEISLLGQHVLLLLLLLFMLALCRVFRQWFV